MALKIESRDFGEGYSVMLSHSVDHGYQVDSVLNGKVENLVCNTNYETAYKVYVDFSLRLYSFCTKS